MKVIEDQARDTAGMTIRLVIDYVRQHAGDDGVRRLLALAGLDHHPIEVLDDERRWWPFTVETALFDAAEKILGDPDVGFHVGQWMLDSEVGRIQRLLLSAVGSPQQVLRIIARVQPKFATNATTTAVEVTDGRAVVAYRLHEGHAPSVQDCGYTQGLLSQVPKLFGLPPARVHHGACQVDGADTCVYELTWPRRGNRWQRLLRRRIAQNGSPYEVAAMRDQLDDLQRIVAVLVSTEDLDEVLRHVSSRASMAVGAQRHLMAVRLDGDPTPRILEDGLGDEVAHAAGTALLEGRLDERPDGQGHRLAVEIVSARHAYGWLAAYLPPGHEFLPGEEDRLASYARLAAVALDGATALARSRAREAVTEALLSLAHDLATETDETHIASRVLAAVPAVVGATRASLLEWDPDGRRLTTLATHGDEARSRFMRSLVIEADEVAPLAELVADPGPRVYRADHPHPFIREVVERLDADMIAGSPVLVHGEFAGVLFSTWQRGTHPPTDHEQLFRGLAGLTDQAGIAFGNARLLERTRRQATHDALTGLANRVLFTERIERALLEADRTGAQVAVLFLDLDGFKAVNDRFGHAAGDELLRQVGERLLATVRASDTVARLAGDEFAVLLRDVRHADGAARVAAMIVEDLAVPFGLEGVQVTIGASVGVAHAPRDGRDADGLLRASDAAMYVAKRERGTYRFASLQPIRSPAEDGGEVDGDVAGVER